MSTIGSNPAPQTLGAESVVTRNTEGLNSQIESATSELSGLQDVLTFAREALAEAQRDKPEKSDTSDMSEDAAKKANEKFSTDMNAWQARVKNLEGNVKTAEADVKKAESKLNNLKGQTSSASAKDAQATQKNIEQAKEASEPKGADVDGGTEDVAQFAAKQELKANFQKVAGSQFQAPGGSSLPND